MADDTWDGAPPQIWDDGGGQTWNAPGEIDVYLVGFQLSTSLGSVVVTTPEETAVMGQQIAALAGTVSVKIGKTVAVTGQSLTTALGDVVVYTEDVEVVTPDGLIALTQLGAVLVSASINLPVTGQSLFIFEGFVSAQADAIAVIVGESSDDQPWQRDGHAGHGR